MSVLGIDFGTTNSSASYINSSGKPEAIRFMGHDMKMPSVVSFYNYNTMYGYEAKYLIENVYRLPQEEQEKLFASMIQSIKRNLQDNGTFCGYSHKDIVAMFIKHIREQAEKACAPQRFDSLVLTHPVQFEEWKKQLLKDAARQAGFNQVELLEEPVAAAIGYINSQGNESVRGMLVYDFGGGTFDVAYVTLQDNKFVVPLAPQGDSHCGGDDIDQALYDYIAQKATKVTGDDYQNERDLGLYFNCRRWKEMLSEMQSMPITVMPKNRSGENFNHTLKRSELENLAANIVERTIRMTRSVYEEVKENRLPLDYILLIGGSSCIPMIQEKLKEALPDIEIRTTGTADIAVALGASCHAVHPVVVDPENEWCYCMYDGKKILKTYNFCIYCGKPNFFKTGKF